MKKESKFIQLYLDIYDVTVLVTWEKDAKKIIKHLDKISINKTEPEFSRHIEKLLQRGIGGFCTDFGTDKVIWIQKRPEKNSEYGVLYHELYHSVDHISRDKSMESEWEAKAYMFQYLVEHCNKVLW